jgi:hypothetical protein
VKILTKEIKQVEIKVGDNLEKREIKRLGSQVGNKDYEKEYNL